MSVALVVLFGGGLRKDGAIYPIYLSMMKEEAKDLLDRLAILTSPFFQLTADFCAIYIGWHYLQSYDIDLVAFNSDCR